MVRDNSTKHIWRGRIIRYAPIVLWIGVIFFLSSPEGSMAETSRFIRPLLRFVFPTTPEETLQIYHGYIRKSAHFIEYAILACFGVRALSRSFHDGVRKLRFVLPLLLVAVIAPIDEFNQSFEASRTGSIYDVLLDLSGGAAVVAVLSFFMRRSRIIVTKAGSRRSE